MKRKKPMNTTKPSVERLEADGYVVQNVEVYLPWARRKRDFCNFADLLAFKAGESGVLAIQATSRDHISARVRKCRENPHVRTWLLAGNRLQVWGWYRVPEGRKKLWCVSIRHVVLPDSHSAREHESDSEKKCVPQEQSA